MGHEPSTSAMHRVASDQRRTLQTYSTPLLFTLRPGNDGSMGVRDFGRFFIGGLSLVLGCTSFIISEWFWLSDPLSRAERLSGAVATMFVLALLELQRIGKPDDPGLRSQFSGELEHATSNIR